MKSKLFKILGVVAIVAMLASTLIALPASAITGVNLAVTPNAQISAAGTTYTVTFSVGLTQNKNAAAFVFTFDSGINVAGVTAAGTTFTAGPGLGFGAVAATTPAVGLTVVGQVVTIDTSLATGMNVDVGAGAIVQLIFTGITNPATIGSYGVTVKTAAETTGVYSNTITTTAPVPPPLPGTASVYNSAGILMSTSTSLNTALGAVAAFSGGKITLTAGTYADTAGPYAATNFTLQGIDPTSAANVIIKSTAAWSLTGATVVIDRVTIDSTTAGSAFTMSATTAGTISNSTIKAGTTLTINGLKDLLDIDVVTVANGKTGITIGSTAATVRNSVFTIAGTGLGILASTNTAITGCTFNGAAGPTGTVDTGWGVQFTTGTSSIKTSAFSGLSTALWINNAASVVTFDGNTVDACGYFSSTITYDTIKVTATAGLTITNNKITNSKNYIINAAANGNLIVAMVNTFAGNAKNALGTVAIMNVTHNFWSGAAAPASTTTENYANPLGAAQTSAAISAASPTFFDATTAAGVNVTVTVVPAGAYFGASALATSPVTATLPSSVTAKRYYDVFATAAPTASTTIRFYGTTAAPVVDADTIYFYNSGTGKWVSAGAAATTNSFANYVEVTFASATSIPSWSNLVGNPFVLVTVNPVAPVAPSLVNIVPATAATGVGISNASFSWTPVAGAATYNFVLSTSSTFAAAGNVFTASPATNGVVVAKTLAYNTTYYWEVQSVDSTGALKSAFTTSFFTTALQATPVLTPALGEQGVSLTPTFTWSAVPGAVSYEFALAQEIGAVNKFDILDYSNNTVTNGITAQETLLYSTTYNWEYRSVDSTGAKSAWTVSFFTTMDKPAVVTTTASTAVVTTQPTIIITQPTVTQTPITIISTTGTPASPAIPSYLLWAVIAVGAVLVIAVIVLIVRTRRIP